MLVKTFVLVVMTVIEGGQNFEFIEFKTLAECYRAEITVENTTQALAKCVEVKKEQI